MKDILILISSLILVIGLYSFSKKPKPLKLLPKEIQKTYAHIPSGSFSLRPENSYGESARVNAKLTEIEEFYILKTEISNINYREFLFHLKSKGELEKLAIAQLDSTRWKESLTYGEPLTNLYHWHPAYNDYPVVNISQEAALLYCEFLEEVLNLNSEITYEVSLPNRAEWTYAAEGMKKHSTYPWGGPFLKNQRGCALANFKMIGAESVAKKPNSDEFQVIPQSHPTIESNLITAPVASYFPNNWGLYNMSGNVAEMISEEGIACGGGWNSAGFDVRCNSTIRYESPQSDIGFRPIIRILK